MVYLKVQMAMEMEIDCNLVEKGKGCSRLQIDLKNKNFDKAVEIFFVQNLVQFV